MTARCKSLATQCLAHSCDEAFDMASEALTDGASKDDVLAVAEHLARFGYEKAGRLRDKAHALWPSGCGRLFVNSRSGIANRIERTI